MSKFLASRLNYNGPRQIYAPNPLLVAVMQGTNDKPSIQPVINVPVPDSRCRIKVSVVFVPRSGQTSPNISLLQTIWIAACDEDYSGGGTGRIVPVTDIEGSSGAPTAFPITSGLLGYSREFVTAADWIQVTLNLVTTANVGAWMVQTQIQPDSVRLEWDEWDAIRREFQPVPAGPRGLL